jgi:hypothetical protein
MMCIDQIKVINISITTNICPSVLGTLELLFSSYFEIYHTLFYVIVTLLYCRTNSYYLNLFYYLFSNLSISALTFLLLSEHYSTLFCEIIFF